MLKEKTYEPRVLYPANISFKYKEEIKTISDDRELREFVASRSTLKNTKTKFFKQKGINKSRLEISEKKNTISKNTDKCNRLFYFSPSYI